MGSANSESLSARGLEMSALGAHADHEAPRDCDVGKALSLMEAALAIIDKSNSHSDVGARLQDVIDALRAKIS